jgi:hypothetical protein
MYKGQGKGKQIRTLYMKEQKLRKQKKKKRTKGG